MTFFKRKNFLYCSMVISEPNSYIRYRDRKFQSKYYRYIQKTMKIIAIIVFIHFLILQLLKILLQPHVEEIHKKIMFCQEQIEYIDIVKTPKQHREKAIENAKYINVSKDKVVSGPVDTIQLVISQTQETMILNYLKTCSEEDYKKQLQEKLDIKIDTLEQFKQSLITTLGKQIEKQNQLKTILKYLSVVLFTGAIINQIIVLKLRYIAIVNLYREMKQDKIKETGKVIDITENIAVFVVTITITAPICIYFLFSKITKQHTVLSVFLLISVLITILLPKLFNQVYKASGIELTTLCPKKQS